MPPAAAPSPRSPGASAPWLALALALALPSLGCAASPCGPGACGEGSMCVLGACQPRTRVPVGDRSERRVMFPGDVAAVAENLPGGGHATLALGGRGPGEAALFLDFQHDLEREDAVEAAYVVADPADGAITASAWVEVEARDVTDRFAGGSVDWARRPGTGRPVSAARTRGAVGTPLRIDVTDLVRGWIRAGRREGRVALVARPEADVGATFSTGLGAGPAPRLEVYLR